MRVGTPGFVGARLREAREARGLTAASLAELLSVSRQLISQYETASVTPGPELMFRIASTLNMPVAFFGQAPREPNDARVFYRSLSAATKGARTKAARRLGWLDDIVTYVRQFVELPPVSFPSVDTSLEPSNITRDKIDEAAAKSRLFWRLGEGPISNIAWLAENNGAVVSRGVIHARALDAFSTWGADSQRPYIFLTADKASRARSRFDIAHEIGHLVLHRDVRYGALRNLIEHKLVEDQADMFASSFLLPASAFARDIFAPTLDAMRFAKSKWHVSIAAMIVRSRELGMITAEHSKQLWISRARRGWSTREPLDDELAAEEPRLLRRSIELIIDQNVVGKSQMLTNLHLPASDVEELAVLTDNYFGEEAPPIRMLDRSPRLARRPPAPRGDVVPFPAQQHD